MNLSRRQLLQIAAVIVALCAESCTVGAEAGYPTRPVRVIVPYNPGGGTDIFARLAAQKLSERLGQQFYVDNIAGAGGMIGTRQAARAAPDGYTVLFTFGGFTVIPNLAAKVSYDPNKDFEPITMAVATTTVLTVTPSLPNTVKELVAIVRANPGKYNFAHPGIGSVQHLVGEQFRLSLGLDLVPVPFSGAGPAVASVVAGHTPIGFSSLAAAAPFVKDGTLRALAVTSNSRSQTLPDVPTMTEAGLPDILGESWTGVLVPAGTSKDISSLLYREIIMIVDLPDMRERLATLGYEPVASTPDGFAQRIKAEVQIWGQLIQAANIKAR
jgi:tripartite-type tricarboxylate transporter receptor subunit TctC